MTITFNETFRKLLEKYQLPEHLDFSVNFPTDIVDIIEGEIMDTDLGITLKAFNRLHKPRQDWGENQSVVEDFENHFHVDWLVDPADVKGTLKLDIATVTSLARKFQEKKIEGVRFSLSFQTPEMARSQWERSSGIADENEFGISERISFFKRRKGEEVIADNWMEDEFQGILIIDI